MLVRRGYDSDPSKAWKEAQNKNRVIIKMSQQLLSTSVLSYLLI